MTEQVIELSVVETNKLRAELGLTPLRVSKDETDNEKKESITSNDAAASTNEEVLEMSVDETNALRAKLGLAPLTTSKSTKEVVHKPAENDGQAQEAAARIEQARLRREVEKGVASTFGSSTLADGNAVSALSWADQMRSQPAKKEKSKKEKPKAASKETYGESDLDGLQVAHSAADLDVGSTTVLTLADAPLLQTKTDKAKREIALNDGEAGAAALENVNLVERSKQEDGLRKKRQLELGMGRAGGYAGFDDDEFEELGGTMGPSRQERGTALLGGSDMTDEGGAQGGQRGFRIGRSAEGDADENMTDFDKMQTGKAISLVPTKADVAASDYMTWEEEQREEEERAMKKRKKDGKFKKKKKKKKEKKHRKVNVESDQEGDDEQIKLAQPKSATRKLPSVLQHLEKSADADTSGLRKRRRRADSDEVSEESVSDAKALEKASSGEPNKQTKYEEIMAKGNERTKLAFEEKPKKVAVDHPVLDEEPDDSFLNAALAKARRLNRLRQMNKPATPAAIGAAAIAETVKSINSNQADSGLPDQTESSSGGGLTFTNNDISEFTLAIRARAQQKERETEKSIQQQSSKSNTTKTTKQIPIVIKQEAPTAVETVENPEDAEEDVDMEELAKEIKQDDIPPAGLDGSTANAAGVGRGLSSFVSMLKTTGEISGNAGKEELKGRAKDERNYTNYEPMDLSKVVKIGRNATDKDKELASREVKLEYRDKHGRLLTTKEAWRDMNYQFHGHGASKRTEDKRRKQIEREQAQTRMASRQVAAARDGTAGGTMGALTATQKATGKAFVVHKS